MQNQTKNYKENTKLLLLVDGSNMAYIGGKKPLLRYLQLIISELETKKIPHTVFVDATLRHRFENEKDKNTLNSLIDDGKINQTPAGRRADDLIMQLALKRQNQGENIQILTNDTFPEKEAGGVIPRITVSYIKIADDEELLFSPSLETLIEYSKVAVSKERDKKVEQKQFDNNKEEVIGNNELLLTAFMTFVYSYKPPIKEGGIIFLTTVAGFLHNQFEGNFCKKFGYKKPIEFAYMLEKMGFVIIRRKGLVVSLEITKKLLTECQKCKK